MLKFPETRFSVSNSAVLASDDFLVPITLRSEAKGSQTACDSLRQAFDDVRGFVPKLAGLAPDISLVSFDANISPRLSRVEMDQRGKESRFHLTFAFRCPIPKTQDFWARLQFIASVYDLVSELAKPFDSRKGVDFFLEEARLEKQKEDPERLRMFRK